MGVTRGCAPMLWTLSLLILKPPLTESFLPATRKTGGTIALKLTNADGTGTESLLNAFASNIAKQLENSYSNIASSPSFPKELAPQNLLPEVERLSHSAMHALEQLPTEYQAAATVLPVVALVAPYVQLKTPQRSEEEMYPEAKAATYELSSVKLPLEFGDPAFVRPLLKQTQLEYKKLQVAYDANKDGYDARIFHKKVDGKGAAVVLAKANGQWFGGYNPRGWASLGGSRPSIASFLFYKKFFGGWVKCRALGNGGMACGNDLFDRGIYLGAEGLVIPLDGDRRVASRLGTYFEERPKGRLTVLNRPGEDLRLQELKILVGVYAKGEDIPNSGGVLDLGLY